MIICEQVLTAVSEFNGEYQGKTAEEVIHEYGKKDEAFNLYVLVEEKGVDVLLYNIYSIGDGMQGEYAIYSIPDKKVYHSVNNDYPYERFLKNVSEIFTREQFTDAGVSFLDGVPEFRSTGYDDWMNSN